MPASISARRKSPCRYVLRGLPFVILIRRAFPYVDTVHYLCYFLWTVYTTRKIVLHRCVPLLCHDAAASCAMQANSLEAAVTHPNVRAHESEDAARIRELIEAWRQAVLAKDVDALVSHYAPDVVVF